MKSVRTRCMLLRCETVDRRDAQSTAANEGKAARHGGQTPHPRRAPYYYNEGYTYI